MTKELREAAKVLREDAVECWGIRRKMNLKAAAKLLEEAADMQERERLSGVLIVVSLLILFTFVI